MRELILAFADDEHLMGQQHTEWIGVAPFLEEDLAFSSIGQDELGHAAMLYELLVGADDAAIDKIAYDRSAAEYRSCHFCEYQTNDWAEALIRHWMYDLAEKLRWELFADSSVIELCEIASRALREESYHRLHAETLVDALLASSEAAERLRSALYGLVPLALGLFEGVASEADCVANGVVAAPFGARIGEWKQLVEARFGGVVWSAPPPRQHQRTSRSDAWQPLMTRMREVLDFDREAIW